VAKTVLLGASTNPSRYAYLAFNDLHQAGHEVVPVSIKKGSLKNINFLDLREQPKVENVCTVTLYIGTRHLAQWIPYILSLKPKRIIMNPGTEHPELLKLNSESDEIEVISGCTLVMLRTKTY